MMAQKVTKTLRFKTYYFMLFIIQAYVLKQKVYLIVIYNQFILEEKEVKNENDCACLS